MFPRPRGTRKSPSRRTASFGHHCQFAIGGEEDFSCSNKHLHKPSEKSTCASKICARNPYLGECTVNRQPWSWWRLAEIYHRHLVTAGLVQRPQGTISDFPEQRFLDVPQEGFGRSSQEAFKWKVDRFRRNSKSNSAAHARKRTQELQI